MPPNTNSDNDEGTAPGAVGHARIKVLLYRKSNRELGAAACHRIPIQITTKEPRRARWGTRA